VASRPDVVPIRFDGRKLEVRRGGTILGSALKNGVRLMHVCGARMLCATCRVRIDAGAENPTPMSGAERQSTTLFLRIAAGLHSSPSKASLLVGARRGGPVATERRHPATASARSPIASFRQYDAQFARHQERRGLL
jgi:ferredoxin